MECIICTNKCEATSQLTWTWIKSRTVERDTKRPKTDQYNRTELASIYMIREVRIQIIVSANRNAS